MSNRIFACAVAAPMCLIATPLVADVMFDNTLDGTRATNPNAQSTFSFTNGNARAFAFKIDDGFDFNLSSLMLGLYVDEGGDLTEVTGSLTVTLFELDSAYQSPEQIASEQVSGLVVQAAGSYVELDFQSLDDITLQGGNRYGLKIGSATSNAGKIRGIQTPGSNSMATGDGVTFGSYVRANQGEWYLNNARLLGQLNGTASSVVPGPAAAMTLLAGLTGITRRRRR